MWRGPMLNKWIQNFLANTHWGELDYLLLDLPPGTGDVAIDVAAMIPQAKEIIVTTPHNVASFVASRVGVMAKHTKHEILGIVENMAYYEEQDGSKNYLFGKGGGEMLAEQLQTESHKYLLQNVKKIAVHLYMMKILLLEKCLHR